MELLDIIGRAALRAALRFCCVPEDSIDTHLQRAAARQPGGARLICYLDGLSEDVVMRQLQFRKTRKLKRDASHSSMTSLVAVSEEAELPQHPSTHNHFDIPRTMSTPAMSSLIDPVRLRASNSDERLKKLDPFSSSPMGIRRQFH